MKKTMWIKGFMEWKILSFPFMNQRLHKRKKKKSKKYFSPKQVVGYCCPQCFISHCLGSALEQWVSVQLRLSAALMPLFSQERRSYLNMSINLLCNDKITALGSMDASGRKRQRVVLPLGKHFWKDLCSTFASAWLTMTLATFWVIWGTYLKVAAASEGSEKFYFKVNTESQLKCVFCFD